MGMNSRVGRLEKVAAAQAPPPAPSHFEKMFRYRFIDPQLEVLWTEFVAAWRPPQGEPAPVEVQAWLAKRAVDRINEMREEDYGVDEKGWFVYRPAAREAGSSCA